MQLEQIQQALREARLDGWLFYDHHHRDPIAERILGLPTHGLVSRRWYYFIPAHGAPAKLVHRIEAARLDSLEGTKQEYSSWQELEAGLAAMLEGSTMLAMQYSPRNAIMYVAMVDAGTVELLRAMGKTIVSSADLVSQFEAVLTEAQIATHFEAQRKLDEILRAGFHRIGHLARTGHCDEYTMVQWLRQAIAAEGLYTDHGPNVSAGPNSADSHYDPTPASSRTIKPGDFILIDIWAKLAAPGNSGQPDPDAIWYDITWTGVIDREPSAREQLIFSTVRDARDAAIRTVQQAFASGIPIAGWQADDAAREVIRAAGFAPAFTHRTGHNIAGDLHGNGAHLDNLETHDERLILPHTCFSVEPGLYFPHALSASEPAFGVRSEVDMMAYSDRAVVTGPAQAELLRI